MADAVTAGVARLEDQVRIWAAAEPDGQAVVHLGTGQQLTWRELDTEADSLLGLLQELGVQPGDRVGWLGANDPAYPVLSLAARRGRFVLAGLNFRLPQAEVMRAAEVIRPTIIIGQEGLLEPDADGRHLVIPKGGARPWIGHAPGQTAVPSPDDPFIMFFTSGATGTPKAVLIDRQGHEMSVREYTALDFGFGDRMLVVPPVFHLAGAMWAQYAMTYGGTQVYLDDMSGAGIAQALESQQITQALLVPALLHILIGELAQRPRSFPELRFVAYGASPIPAPLLRQILELLPCKLMQVYGLSEAGGVVVELGPAEHTPESPVLLAAGKPINSTRVRIVDPATDEDLPAGKSGEIVLSCDHLMVGYWERPDMTAAAIRDGWLYTKDAGRQDEAGYVFIEGRIDDMIITGGENVQPAEVERVLSELPGVSECAIVGVADPKWGQRLVAAVVVADGAQLDAEQVLEWCRPRLAKYQCPKDVVFLAQLPRNATGKLQRRDLAESAELVASAEGAS